MIAAILSVVAALIGFFASKKAGANDATAAAVGVAAGAGTYWTATQTDWGKATVDKIDNWWSPPEVKEDIFVMDEDGNSVKIPSGSQIMIDGKPMTLPEGYTTDNTGRIIDATGKVVGSLTTNGKVQSVTGEVFSSAKDLLSDWGPAGTAAVIGAGTIAAKTPKIEPWMLMAGASLALLVILK